MWGACPYLTPFYLIVMDCLKYCKGYKFALSVARPRAKKAFKTVLQYMLARQSAFWNGSHQFSFHQTCGSQQSRFKHGYLQNLERSAAAALADEKVFSTRYPNHSNFISIKHLHEIPTGSPPAGALNTGGVYTKGAISTDLE